MPPPPKHKKAPRAATMIESAINEDHIQDSSGINWGDEDLQQNRVLRDDMDSSTNIRVAVRCRPPNKRELAGGEGGGVVVTVPGSSSSDGVVKVEGNAPYKYDLAFPMNTTQLQVFEAIGVDIVQSAFNGYNASLFAYGQTSSGKSFSMMGVIGSDLVGIIPRIARLLFHTSRRVEKHFMIETSYLEIYNEKLRDLLSNGKESHLKVRENKQLGVHVTGLNREMVTSCEETLEVIDHGFNQRTTAATLYNSESSRSHAVFEIHIKAKFKNTNTGEDMISSSRIALIDLAGSERSDKLGSKGKAMKEGNNINKSLTVLGRCIRALVEESKGKKVSVPFRESVLTWYLRDSLAGNARTTMLAACSPVASNMEETLSTLRYAASAKNIKTKAVKNEDPAQAKIRELSAELELLKKRLEEVEQPGKGRSLSVVDMTKEEKMKLFEELNLQMGVLQTSDFNQNSVVRRRSSIFTNGPSTSRRKSILSSTHQTFPQYPCLSCLNKDDLLSHVMTIPLSTGTSSPQACFTIGRTLDVRQDLSTTSQVVKNDFELNGMGIKSRHCCFKNSDQAEGLVVQPLSLGATVYVNGSTLEELEASRPLKHLDRIILGPGRLFCLFLTKPLQAHEREIWDYETCFQEMMLNGARLSAQALSAEVLSTNHKLSLKRRTLIQQWNMIEADQVTQGNIMACEMGVPVRFEVEIVVQGKQGYHQSDLTLDDFLDSNEVKTLVRCYVPQGLKIQTASDLVKAYKEYDAHKRENPIVSLHAYGGSALDISSSKPRSSVLFDPRDSSVELLTENAIVSLNGDDVEEEEEGSEAYILDREVLFEIGTEEFEDLLQDMKVAYTSISTLTGGLMSSVGTSATSKRNSTSSVNEVSSGIQMVRNVFDLLDADKSGTIDREELERGIYLFNNDHDPTYIAEIWAEEGLTEDVNMRFSQFEEFLIRFMQRQFYKCLESVVTNKTAFVNMGGRDLHRFAKEVFKDRAQQQHLSKSISFRMSEYGQGSFHEDHHGTTSSHSVLAELLQHVGLAHLAVEFNNAHLGTIPALNNRTDCNHPVDRSTQDSLLKTLLEAIIKKEENEELKHRRIVDDVLSEQHHIQHELELRVANLETQLSTSGKSKGELKDETTNILNRIRELETEEEISNRKHQEVQQQYIETSQFMDQIYHSNIELKHQLKEDEARNLIVKANLKALQRKLAYMKAEERALLAPPMIQGSASESLLSVLSSGLEAWEVSLSHQRSFSTSQSLPRPLVSIHATHESKTVKQLLNEKDSLLLQISILDGQLSMKDSALNAKKLQLEKAVLEGVEKTFALGGNDSNTSKSGQGDHCDENSTSNLPDNLNADIVSKLSNELQIIEMDIAKLLECKSKFGVQLTDLENVIEMKQCAEDLQLLANQYANNDSTIVSMKDTVVQNDSQYSELQQLHEKLQLQVEALSVTLTSLHDEKIMLMHKLTALTNILESVETSRESPVVPMKEGNEVSILSKQDNDKESVEAQLRIDTEKDKVREELSAIYEEMFDNLHRENNELQERNAELEKKNLDLQNEYLYEQKIEDLSLENDEMKMMVIQLNRENEEVQRMVVLKFEKEMETLRAANEKMSTMIVTLKQENNDMKDKVNKDNVKIKALIDTKHSVNGKWEQDVETLKQQLETMRTEKEKLVFDLEKHKRENSDNVQHIKSEREIVKHTKKQLTTLREEYAKEKKVFEGKLKGLENKIIGLNREKTELLKKLNDKEESVAVDSTDKLPAANVAHKSEHTLQRPKIQEKKRGLFSRLKRGEEEPLSSQSKNTPSSRSRSLNRSNSRRPSPLSRSNSVGKKDTTPLRKSASKTSHVPTSKDSSILDKPSRRGMSVDRPVGSLGNESREKRASSRDRVNRESSSFKESSEHHDGFIDNTFSMIGSGISSLSSTKPSSPSLPPPGLSGTSNTSSPTPTDSSFFPVFSGMAGMGGTPSPRTSPRVPRPLPRPVRIENTSTPKASDPTPLLSKDKDTRQGDTSKSIGPNHNASTKEKTDNTGKGENSDEWGLSSIMGGMSMGF